MGVYISSRCEESSTPLFIPRDTDRTREVFSKFLGHGDPSSIEIRVVPFSNLLDPEEKMAIVYNGGTTVGVEAKPNNLAIALMREPNGPTPPLVIMDPALLFHLEPGKDYRAEVDHKALLAIHKEAWLSPTDIETMRSLWKTKLAAGPLHPGQRTVDAILFPALHDTPRIVKVPTVNRNPMEHQGIAAYFNNIADPSYFLGSFATYRGVLERTDSMELRPQGRQPMPLVLYYCENYIMDGSPKTRSLMGMLEGPRELTWKGNILMMRQRRGSYEYVDVEPEDVGFAIKWLNAYGRGEE
jgi:hypothetical protein